MITQANLPSVLEEQGKPKSQTKLVMRFKDNTDDEFVYVGHPSKYSSDGYEVVYNYKEARDFCTADEKTIVDIFEEFSDDYSYEDCEICFVTISIQCLKFPSTLISELHQRKAIAKLTDAECEALGIRKIQTYIKTKYG